MLKRLTTITVLTLAVAAIAATPASARRACGHSVGYQVTVIRGSVPCAQARTVAKDWATGKHAITHRVGSYNLWYFTLPGGWVCGTLDHGVAGCFRGGIGSLAHGFTYEAARHAHEEIEMLIPG